ncbi:isopentenyl-diphosphate Delta-isomerase [Actinomadura sp. NEAU-AAG7]|uniref:isopentenyl-diphosphate Delta-isomerase n=1 Tax=Actinomadura sp. NEAU-AAG7 TaxID=2839640 RepID=UPI0027DEF8C1|nr:isopentenyl-diphosphate Delta-isomerase [Actinomadura sp. NEAU-AAG7]
MSPVEEVGEEMVVLLDWVWRAVGAAPKRTVHHSDTPLHLAFTCYAFDTGGWLLLTRRAWTKKTWPGVWANTCCGHPAPGEALHQAVQRRLEAELGTRAARLDVVLGAVRYRAVMANGIMENEVGPAVRVHLARPPPRRSRRPRLAALGGRGRRRGHRYLFPPAVEPDHHQSAHRPGSRPLAVGRPSVLAVARRAAIRDRKGAPGHGAPAAVHSLSAAMQPRVCGGSRAPPGLGPEDGPHSG